MKKLENPDWVPLQKYIETLLRQGKRSKDSEFKTLMDIYGKEKITGIATRILGEWKKGDGRDGHK